MTVFTDNRWEVGELPDVPSSDCPSGWGSYDPFTRDLTANCTIPTTVVHVGAWFALITDAWAVFCYIGCIWFALKRDAKITAQNYYLPVGVLYFICNGIVFGFPAHTLDGHGILLGASYVLIFAHMHLFLTGEGVQTALKTILALDPHALKEINIQINQTAPTQVASTFTMFVSAVLLAETSDPAIAVSRQAVLCAGCAFSSMTCAYSMWGVYHKTGHKRKTSVALLEESPGRKFHWQTIRTACLSFSITLMSCGVGNLFVALIFAKTGGAYFALLTFVPVSVIVLFPWCPFMLYFYWSTNRGRAAHIPRTSRQATMPLFRSKHNASIQSTLNAAKAAEANMVFKKVCKRGVSLPFLQRFMRECGIRREDPTWKVCDRVVKPATEHLKCSYFNMLGTGRDREGHPWAGSQSVFVSHTWSDPFCELVDTITEFERTHHGRRASIQTERRIYYYIDVFVLNQWEFADPAAKLPYYDIPKGASFGDFMLQTLDESIDNASTILSAIQKWDQPTSLSRIWCLFELWRGIIKQKKIRMGFPRKEATRFTKAVHAQELDLDQFVERNVDVTKAEATVKRDLQTICAKIRESVGEAEFNATLQQKLMATFALCAIHTNIDDNIDEEAQKHNMDEEAQVIAEQGEIVSIHTTQGGTSADVVVSIDGI